jgi:O-antigen ligase
MPTWVVDGRGGDLLLALATGAIFLEAIVGPGKAALFVAFSLIVFLVHLPRLMNARWLWALTATPATIFLLMHVAFALRVETGAFILKAFQVGVAAAFVWPLVVRYSNRSMRHYLRYLSVILCLIAAWTAIWHIQNGFYVGWKRLLDTKTAFVLMPLMLVAVFSAKRPRTISDWALFAGCSFAILMSGERKAYILLAISLFFIVSPRNPASLAIPLGALIFQPVALALDSTGYVRKQLDTISGLAGGTVVESVSNMQRQWQWDFAMSLVRENPALGVGTNGYVKILNDLYGSEVKSQVIVPGLGLHGEVLRVLVENGIAGLILLLFVVIYSIYSIIFLSARKVQVGRRDQKLQLFVFLTLMVYMATEAFDSKMALCYVLLPHIWRLRLSGEPRTATGLRT